MYCKKCGLLKVNKKKNICYYCRYEDGALSSLNFLKYIGIYKHCFINNTENKYRLSWFELLYLKYIFKKYQKASKKIDELYRYYAKSSS